MMGKYMETGEVGFCPECGTLAEVVVLPEDRLQERVARAALKQVRRMPRQRRSMLADPVDQSGAAPLRPYSPRDCLNAWVVGLFEAAGWAVDNLQGAAPTEISYLALETARAASQAEAQTMYQDGLRPMWDKEALEELKETLIELQIRLVIAAEALGEALEEPVDLLKLAAERVEK